MTSRMEFRNYRSSAQLVHCNIHEKRYSDVSRILKRERTKMDLKTQEERNSRRRSKVAYAIDLALSPSRVCQMLNLRQ